MNSNFTLQLAALVLIIALLPSPSAASFSTNHNNLGLEEAEEKTKLGSTPPSCHNKCNECHPCFAVQAPTLPTHDRIEPSSYRGSSSSTLMEVYRLPGSGDSNRYSNYKPLGWKCRCNNHFYNP